VHHAAQGLGPVRRQERLHRRQVRRPGAHLKLQSINHNKVQAMLSSKKPCVCARVMSFLYISPLVDAERHLLSIHA
jgi:hypothetical protein